MTRFEEGPKTRRSEARVEFSHHETSSETDAASYGLPADVDSAPLRQSPGESSGRNRPRTGAQQLEPAALSSVTNTRPHVLLVDDEDGVRTAWAEYLGRRGYAVTALTNATDAQHAIFRNPLFFDVIICDLNMPGRTGRELLEAVLPVVRDRIPVVVTSGVRYMIDALGELRHGAFSILPKPVENIVYLADEVERALTQRRLFLKLRATRDENEDLLHKINVLLGQNDELSKRVRVDPLTDTANRVRLFEDLRALDSNRHRYGAQFAIAFVDIDDFGRFNKHQGVEMGDAVLRQVAFSIREACRKGDAIYRFGAHEAEPAYRLGGDEFILVLPAQEEPAAIAAMDRICRHVEESTGLSNTGSSDGPVTLSAGVVSCADNPDLSIDDLLQEANDRLREAKRRGGNQVWPAPIDWEA